jgi:hypothetical protein
MAFRADSAGEREVTQRIDNPQTAFSDPDTPTFRRRSPMSYVVQFPGFSVKMDGPEETLFERTVDLLNKIDGDGRIFFDSDILNGEVEPLSVEEVDDDE